MSRKRNRLFLFVSALLAGGVFLNAQVDGYKMSIELNDGSKVSLNTSDVKEVSFADGKIVVEGSDLMQTILELSDSVRSNSRRINYLDMNNRNLSDSIKGSLYSFYYYMGYMYYRLDSLEYQLRQISRKDSMYMYYLEYKIYDLEDRISEMGDSLRTIRARDSY